MNSDTRYAYSVARIRALERRLLDRAKIETMLEAKSAQDVLKVLAETDYGPLIGEIKDVHQYEQILTGERKRIYDLLLKMAPQKEIIHLFAIKYDYHNLKVLLKAKYLDEDASDLLVDTGTIAPEELGRMVVEEDYRSLPADYRKAVEAVKSAYSQTGDPQEISFILDRALYANLMRLANEYKSSFLQEYFRVQIDLLNIGTFLRVKNLNKSREFMENILLDDGTLAKGVFLKLYHEPETVDALVSRLNMTVYAPIVEEGARDWAKTHTTTHFEKLADNFLLEHAKVAKRINFGAEPLLAYLIAKEIEIRLIRMIMVGKLNGIPIEEIRERLRDVYA